MEQMSIGEFARATHLSPKALRLYDELGLLVPARVDDSSGYRFYDEAQLEQARLVAMLRQLGMPLAEIKVMLSLAPHDAAAQVATYWDRVEQDHTGRRELVTLLVNRLEGKRSAMPDVAVHTMPERSLLCLKRNVDGWQGAWDLGKEFIGVMKTHQMPRMDGKSGAVFAIYHGEVNDDSDGPIEWCRPVPVDRANDLADQIPELTLRLEGAHEEAWVALGQGEIPPARWQVVSDTLEAWVEDAHRRPSGLGMRLIYEWPGAESPNPAPNCSFAVPLS